MSIMSTPRHPWVSAPMSEQAASESVPQRHLTVRAALRTDVGLVRSENQDFGMYTTTQEELQSHPGGRLLIVADGMGGHRGGATASRLAAETVKAQFLGSETTDIPTALRESLTRANARIFAEAQANPELRGMGTTTSVLAVRGEQGWLAHVGDSRIYLVRNDEIQQLTDDHSLVATMVREGLLTSAEAETHPRRNVLQRSMGVAEDVEVDLRGPFELHPGDTFILCSDGLHGLVKEPELKEIAAKPIEAAADEFLRKALERGAPDNVTVIVARVEEADGSTDVTIVDRLDETQPLQPLDETQKDTQKLVAVEDESQKETQKLPAVTEEPASVMPSAVEASPASREAGDPSTSLGMTQAPRKSSGLVWVILLTILAGAAAGGWYYWTNYYAIAKEPARSSPR
ncbi:MAG TPA: Stp1/IreP family PP2C-type Ser/Thr phosphatase [Thermoanaerobaculia bacterium]|nr:Stp1/IreP family PP2C-type Ser/Thr phosphatase [Thermoanaerobaculia bacterium]